jgi:protein N-terminal methyltransferase
MRKTLFLLSLVATMRAVAGASAVDAFSAALTASIVRRRGSFWAVSQNGDGTETRFDSVGALLSARGPVGGPASLAYWAAQPATMDGVVGAGWERSSPLDLAFSASFLGRLRKLRDEGLGGGGGVRRCLHVGAGIGRETGVLLTAGGCATVDLLEPHAHFMAAAREVIPRESLGFTFEVAAEAHEFGVARYDIVLLQWMTNYVSDGDLARVLARAADALRPGGAVLVKDNVSEHADGVHSVALHHMIRSAAYLDAIVEVGAPSLVKIADEAQRPWVEGLFPVRMFAYVRADDDGWVEAGALRPWLEEVGVPAA